MDATLEQPLPPARELKVICVRSVVALLVALTPLMPVSAIVLILGLRRALRAAESPWRTGALALSWAGLIMCGLAVPWLLMFLDDAGLFR
jgi:hypothetical protein